MFDGVPSDQFHQFIAAAAAAAAASSTPPLPLSFVSSSNFPTFDLYSGSGGGCSGGGGGGGGGDGGQQPLQVQVPHQLLLHPLHHHSSSSASAPKKDDHVEKEGKRMVSTNLEPQRERSMLDLIDPWSNDEVLALLSIRSSFENWFPDFTWEHVSRSLPSLSPFPYSLSTYILTPSIYYIYHHLLLSLLL